MNNDIKKNIEIRMDKCIELLKNTMSKVRTGRASTTILDSIKVKYYDNLVPLCQLASITVENTRMLKINLFDISMISLIENTIKKSDLGINPRIEGNNIYIPIPSLTEERRKEIIKLVKNTAEQSRISIRNIRRDSNDKIKLMLKEKKISEDEEHNIQTKIQKITQKYISKIDTFLSEKENELMKF
ncbi:ribosome recycling factor [Candidatus Pantoea edessiphila]|uniref:Ribosome-recycling factor n=1 Tax=Candidatus Pantoea edessiphila TaxID=2044610 RepID=A0A2P5T0C0_9GAMM|nr:ribosome recycling factor [Candidatus Pantoea edessiphila]PPI88000.1 ribosome recycling factor [Candidatus Pantoea edessiphila]